MSEEAKRELKEMSIEELYEILSKTDELMELAKSRIVEVKEEDLKPKRTKRGSKNWLSQ